MINENTVQEYKRFIKCKDRHDLSRLIYEHGDKEILETFSHLRANLIEWIPFCEKDTVLIVGDDRGIFSSVIIEKVAKLIVVCDNNPSIELTKKRCPVIDRLRCKREGIANVSFKKDYFDYIIVVDPFLTDGKTENDDFVNAVFNVVKSSLKQDGVLVWGAHNQLGMKFWSGCKDSVMPDYFSSIEKYCGRQIAGNPSYEDMLDFSKLAPLKYTKMYYPYPDLFYPTSIYSDDFLPGKNELTKNAFSWEERIVTFNEVAVWNNIIRNHMFKQFSNAFLLVMSNDESRLDKLNIFTKYSNDRAEQFSIRTDIFVGEDQKKHVRKIACSEKAKAQILDMVKWEKELSTLYADTNFHMNTIESVGENEMIFEYLEGEPYLKKLEAKLSADDYEGFLVEFEKFTKILIEKNHVEFVETEEFNDVFGYVDLPAGLYATKVGDIDLILSNVMQGKNDSVEIIDYEWVFDFPIPVNFMIYRSIEYLFRGPRGLLNFNGLYMSKLFDRYQIDEKQIAAYHQMEVNFQRWVTDAHIPLRMMNRNIPQFLFNKTPRVYYNFGKGYDMNSSFFCDGIRLANGGYKSKIAIPFGVKKLRIDPSEEMCLVEIKKIELGGDALEDAEFTTNGISLGNNMFIYDTTDSQIVINAVPKSKTYLNIEICVVPISEKMCQNLISSMDDKVKEPVIPEIQ